MMEKFDLTTEDIAHILKVSSRTVRHYIRHGDLYAIRIGRQYRISYSSLIKFQRQHKIIIKEDIYEE